MRYIKSCLANRNISVRLFYHGSTLRISSRDMNVSANVAIFWDYENCPLPATEPCYPILKKIRHLAQQHGSVKTFRAYLEYPEQSTQRFMAVRSELQSCGVSLIDCPHNGRKDVADKMIMVDMMAHAIDFPAPATIILISGDRDFVYAVSVLSLRQYKVILLAPRSVHCGLKAQVDAAYNWPDDFLPELPVVAQSTAPPPSGDQSQERRMSRAAATAAQESSGKGEQAQASPSLPANATVHKPAANSMNKSPSRPADPDSSQIPVSGTRPSSRAANPERSLSVAPAPIVTPSTAASKPKNSRAYATSASIYAEPSHVPESGHPMSLEEGGIAQPSKNVNPPITAPTPLLPPGLLQTPPISSCSPTPAAVGSDQPTTNPTTLSYYDFFANRPSFTFSPAPSSTRVAPQTRDDIVDDGTAWQTFTHVAKKRTTQPPAPFKPLVKVLKRQLAEGNARVESSQLGSLLSAEAGELRALYERAGVTRLKEYTALAAELGVVTLSRESVDGHNYVALHPVHRRKAVEPF